MTTARKLFKRRSNRVRISVKKNNIKNRIRLSVFRSNQHIYAQLIDDCKGITIASASTLNVTEIKKGNNKEAAQYVGQLIAKAAQKNSIKEVVFDKGGYIFHGRVKALADAAREQGLLF